MAISIPIVTEFDGTGINKAVKQFKQLETTGEKAQFALKKAAIPAAAALGGLAAGLFDATKGAMEDAKAQKMLAGQLARTTGATDGQVAAVEDWITAQGKAFGIADDQLRPALSKLATATKDVSRAQQLAKTAMDIASATGKDYESVVTALTKAELGQYASLKKLGLPLGDNTRALMDMAAETKKVAKAQAEYDLALQTGDKKEVAKALEKLTEAQAKLNSVTVDGADYVTDLNKAFGGAAAEAANTAEGGFKRLTLALNETKESIGAALLPAIEKALPKLQGFANWAQDNPDVFVKVAAGIAAVAASTLAVNAAMATNPYVAIAAGILGVSYAFDRLIASVEKVNKVGGMALRVLKVALRLPSFGFFKQLGLLPEDEKSPANSGTGGGLPIPAMANGGVVTAPTLALIGEAGPEAVVPLNKMGGVGGDVNIYVNGGDPQAVVNALRTYMNRYGSVPIRVSST